MDRRIEDLEVKVAFQEHAVAQLDEVIQQLRLQIEALQRDLIAVREQQAAMMPPVEDAPPPHW